MQQLDRRALPVLILLGLAWVGTQAADVGRFAVVQNQVTSMKPGARQGTPARPGAVIVLDELETSGPASAAKMTFGEGAVISIGQNTEFKVTRQAVDQATGASVSTVNLLTGKLRVFVSRFWSGRPEVEVETPTAVVGVKGSEVVVEVFEDGRTVVTVLSGSASVRRKGLPDVRRDLGPNRMFELLPGRDLPDTATPVDDDRLAQLWNDTEADPSPPPGPSSPPGGSMAERSNLARLIAGLSDSGSAMSRPATHTVPEFVVSTDDRGQQPATQE